MPFKKSPPPLSTSERLAQADSLAAEAARYQKQYMSDKKLSKRSQLRLIVRAYFTFSQAIALYEAEGDFTDNAFKRKLAEIYRTCSYCAGRYAYMCRTGDRDLPGAKALHISLYKKSTVLDGESMGDLQGDDWLMAAWAHILHLHNLTMDLIRDGAFAEAEGFARQNLKLQQQFAVLNDEGRLDHRVWLSATWQLATIANALQHPVDSILSIIDSGLSAFLPAQLKSSYSLDDYAELCALKAEVLRKAASEDEKKQED
jgi:hypothetical protein